MDDLIKTTDSDDTTPSVPKKKARKIRKYPTCSFNDALELAIAIQKNAGNQQIRRITLFDLLNRASESGPSRTWITNTAKYGLITGSSGSEFLQLTELGKIVTSDESGQYDKVKASIELGVLNIEAFKHLFETFKGNKLPQNAVLIDALDGQDVDPEDRAEVVDSFIVNIEQTGLLKTFSGAQRIVDVDHALEGLSNSNQKSNSSSVLATKTSITGEVTSGNSHFEKICFYITPIGNEGTEERKHW